MRGTEGASYQCAVRRESAVRKMKSFCAVLAAFGADISAEQREVAWPRQVTRDADHCVSTFSTIPAAALLACKQSSASSATDSFPT